MNELEIKIKELREYCLNINTIDDISFIKDIFIDLNTNVLSYQQKCTVNESLLFMIEQLTFNIDKKVSNINDIKLEIVKEIIEEHITNILESSYYHYYLCMREYLTLGRYDINTILENLYAEDISFINELQKVSFINYLGYIKPRLEEHDTIDLVIEKIKEIKVSSNYPEFAPSKIKQLEDESKTLQEELANLNYILMMQDMV